MGQRLAAITAAERVGAYLCPDHKMPDDRCLTIAVNMASHILAQLFDGHNGNELENAPVSGWKQGRWNICQETVCSDRPLADRFF